MATKVKKEKSTRSAEFAKGGNTPMFGEQAAGPQPRRLEPETIQRPRTSGPGTPRGGDLPPGWQAPSPRLHRSTSRRW